MKKALIIGLILLLAIGGTVYGGTARKWTDLSVEEQAESKGMTIEAYKVALAEHKADKTITKEEFLKELEAKGMTLEEYQTLKKEKLAAVAEAKGMTIEVYKQALSKKK